MFLSSRYFSIPAILFQKYIFMLSLWSSKQTAPLPPNKKDLTRLRRAGVRHPEQFAFVQITDEFDNNLQVLRKVADPPKEIEEETEEDFKTISSPLELSNELRVVLRQAAAPCSKEDYHHDDDGWSFTDTDSDSNQEEERSVGREIASTKRKLWSTLSHMTSFMAELRDFDREFDDADQDWTQLTTRHKSWERKRHCQRLHCK